LSGAAQAGARDMLGDILTRKAREVTRRQRHRSAALAEPFDDREPAAVAALRRDVGSPLRVIAEIKFRSPSAGSIRPRTAGEHVRVARTYEAAGASAISVLCDRPGFGGSPLDLRRVRGAVSVPLVFKEFVIDPVQVELARAVGADMVLLLVRALSSQRLRELVAVTRQLGMAPLVEAADAEELKAALDTGATLVGVNARDLRTFRVDVEAARRAIAAVPADRVAVLMSGLQDADAFARAADTRADAVLVGEALMRARDPGAALRALRAG
jgi:indole-3-glycerol phosphate synthase